MSGYRLTVLPSIVGAGTVTGAGRYYEGTKVTVSAVAAKGFSFVKWSDGVTDATRTVAVAAADDERVIYACFKASNSTPDDGGGGSGGGSGGGEYGGIVKDVSFAKAQTVDGVLYGADGAFAGTVQLKAGKTRGSTRAATCAWLGKVHIPNPS